MASFVKVLYENLSSPAKNVLQSINDNSLRLDNQEEDTLYYMVANIIWVKKGGRTVIELEISFLCSKVIKSTMEDKSKLKCVLQFLKQKIND